MYDDFKVHTYIESLLVGMLPGRMELVGENDYGKVVFRSSTPSFGEAEREGSRRRSESWPPQSTCPVDLQHAADGIHQGTTCESHADAIAHDDPEGLCSLTSARQAEEGEEGKEGDQKERGGERARTRRIGRRGGI